MCTSLNCNGWRVTSRCIRKRVVAGIAKKFDEFVLFNYEIKNKNLFCRICNIMGRNLSLKKNKEDIS